MRLTSPVRHEDICQTLIDVCAARLQQRQRRVVHRDCQRTAGPGAGACLLQALCLADMTVPQVRRLLMVDTHRMLLVESNSARFGWGHVRCIVLNVAPPRNAYRFVSDLNMTRSERDAHDELSLHVSVYAPLPANARVTVPSIIFQGRFLFDDPAKVAEAHHVRRMR